MIQETSRIAYESIKPGLGKRQKIILDLLISSPQGLTNEEISNRLNWPINCVTPRVKELREKGYVISSGTRESSTGRKAIVWVFESSINLKMEESGQLAFI